MAPAATLDKIAVLAYFYPSVFSGRLLLAQEPGFIFKMI
jgi:hypothetical protein